MRVAGQVPERPQIQVGQQTQLPVGQHIRSNPRQIRAGQHIHQLQAVRRAHFHGEFDDNRIVGRVAPLGQLGHHQMFVDQEPQRVRVGLRKPQLLAAFLGELAAHLAVVARIAFPQIMEQQGEMQQIFSSQRAIGFAQRVAARTEFCGAFDRPDRVLVDRELVKIVELHEVPRMGERRHDFFQHPQFMQPSQQFAEPRGLGKQSEETAAKQRCEVDRVLAEHRRADRGPCPRLDPLVGQIRQFHQPQDFRRIAAQLGQTAFRDRDVSRTNSEIAIQFVGHQRREQGLGKRHGPRVGQEVRGDVADFARVPEVIPHQPLDRQKRLVARIPQPIGDATLLGLVENVLRSPSMEVQLVPQPQQELAGRL